MGFLDILRCVALLHLVCLHATVRKITESLTQFFRFELLYHAPRAEFPPSEALRKKYFQAAGYFSFMLITYPIAWACAEGGNVISVTSEMVWYGILDILTIPVFLFGFLWQLRGAEYASFGLHSGKYTDQHEHIDREKGPEPVPQPAAQATQ